MKIKRFTARDMRHVLQRVREEQGPDAVILSNRRVDDGIEVITAIDYDEALMQHALGPTPESPLESDVDVVNHSIQREEAAIDADSVAQHVESDVRSADVDAPTLANMHAELSSVRSLLETQLSGIVWREKSRRSPSQAQMLRNLSRIGLAPDVANIVVNRTPPVSDHKDLWREPLMTLVDTVPVSTDDLIESGGTAALIGPTGVGKTTTVAKIAAQYAMRNGSDEIALICADAYRIGAREHLSAFANIIGTKVHAASTSDELAALLDRLRSKRLVLIDTEGMSQRDTDLSNRLAAFGANSERVRFFLTLSAASQEAGLNETVQQFSKVPLAGTIVTKVDEAAQLGCVMSALIRNNLPLVYLADGQRVPDDLYPAEKKKLWLINQAVDGMEASQPRMSERLMAENYSEMGAAHV